MLLVEDEPAVREIVQRILRDRGYRVHVAADGASAAQEIARWSGPLDLLVTDLVMPGASGIDLARLARSAFPKLRVLYMSGYSDSLEKLELGGTSDASFLAKPFSPKTLSRAVRGLLDSEKAGPRA